MACQYCKYLLAGAILGDCRVLRWIGSGAFGDVYEAEQLPPLNRRVAIKVMAIERVVDGESAEMFAREVSTIATLDHPNILPVLRVGMIDDGRPYLVMKYAALGSLQQFCQPATSTFSGPSLIPTVMHAGIAETPGSELAIVAAKTLSIVEVIENTAETTSTTPDADDDTETTLKAVRESQERAEPDSEITHYDGRQVPDTPGKDQPEASLLHTSKASLPEYSAHQEIRQAPGILAASEGEQAREQVSTDARLPETEAEEAASDTGAEAHTPGSESAPGTDDATTATGEKESHEPGAEADTPQSAPTPPGDLASTKRMEEQASELAGENEEASQDEQAVVDSAATEALENPGEFEAEPDASVRVPEMAVVAEMSDAEQTLKPANEQRMHEGDEEARGATVAAQESAAQVEKASDNTRGLETEQIATMILAGKAQSVATPTMPPSSPVGCALPLSLLQVLGYVEEAASALYYAHQRGLIHLDVKPANLLLDAQGRLMLADFGVSVLLEGYTHASLHYYVGTPLYTAPEQWLEQPRTASDQYALAVTCYQLLTGRPPFTGNLYAVMHGHLQAMPPPMYELNPLIPAQVEGVIRHALAKDPVERYPDILVFARAFREAVENAANADTDTQMQQRAALLLEQNAPVIPSPNEPSVSVDEFIEEKKVDKKLLPESGTFRAQQDEWELPTTPRRRERGHWLRNLFLCVLAVLLIAGGSLSFVRSQRPCWLGICPQILLSTHALTLTNDELQPIEITNTGTDTLHWQATLPQHTPWLGLSAANGILAPGHASRVILKTDVDGLNLDPGRVYTYTDTIDISGGPGVATQTIEVTENVAKGLSAVSVNTSGQGFLYEQNKLHPGKQTITITNQSGHTLNWFTQYTDNNWLSVTPSQGSLKNTKSATLTVTVENPQKLANDTYQVRFSLVGQLDNQSDFTLLQTTNFTLQVNQSQTAQVAPTIPPVLSPTIQPTSLSFTAQPISASGAPTGQRFNHSMVWDTQDNQLLVFGGSDAQGGLLNDLWSYSPTKNTWTNLTPASSSSSANASVCSGSSPVPRMSATMVWDSTNQEALLYGGIGSNNSYLGDLWSYSPAQGTWKALACSGNSPGARGEAGAAWNGSQMLLLGGLGASGSLADFWAYTPGTGGGWSQLAATTPLGARAYPAMSWDSHDKQLFVFGGLGANGQQFGDFFAYQSGNGWTNIEAGNGATPLARQQALSTWDSKNRVFLLMGGWQSSNNTTYSALWAYSPSDNAWWQINSLHNNGSTSVIPSRMASVMVWDSTDNRAYIYAGSSGENKGALNDLWMITPG